MGRPGMRKRRAQAPDADRARMWKSMRMLLQFTVGDIEATAEVARSNATKYIRALASAQYLRCLVPRTRGATGGHALWQLIRNTGPVPPRISKGGIYDANVEEPVARPEDKPLLRWAPALLLQLHKAVDLLERLDAGKQVDDAEFRQVVADSRAFIDKAEGRA
jgi:hypothetical protein